VSLGILLRLGRGEEGRGGGRGGEQMSAVSLTLNSGVL